MKALWEEWLVCSGKGNNVWKEELCRLLFFLLYAFHFLHNTEDSEECVNDTWFCAWNAMPPQRPGRLRMFLAKITRNLSINCFNARNAEKRGGGEIILVLDELAECIAGKEDVEAAYEVRELEQCIRCFVRALPERDGNVFVRWYFFVELVAVIAKRYGITENFADAFINYYPDSQSTDEIGTKEIWLKYDSLGKLYYFYEITVTWVDEHGKDGWDGPMIDAADLSVESISKYIKTKTAGGETYLSLDAGVWYGDVSVVIYAGGIDAETAYETLSSVQ